MFVEDLRSSSTSIDITAFQRSSSFGGKNAPSLGKQSLSEAEFVNRLNGGRSMSIHAVPYPLVDLQSATANFASGRLLGNGTVGRVYRAKNADGKVHFATLLNSFYFIEVFSYVFYFPCQSKSIQSVLSLCVI